MFMFSFRKQSIVTMIKLVGLFDLNKKRTYAFNDYVERYTMDCHFNHDWLCVCSSHAVGM